MSERMLVTQALDERDLLKKKIVSAISKSKLVAVKKPEGKNIENYSRVSVEEFEKDATADYQSIRDLISRYERLDSAILLSNATTTLSVASVEMTRAAAINLRRSMTSDDGTDFKGRLIDEIKFQLNKANMEINKTIMTADRQREQMIANLTSKSTSGNDKEKSDNISVDALENVNKYCDGLVYKLVDPIDAEETLKKLEFEREQLISNIESAIKISNATTYVEF